MNDFEGLRRGLRAIALKIDPKEGHHTGPEACIWECSKLALDTARATIPEDEKDPLDGDPMAWMRVGMAKYDRQCPQAFADMVEHILGWRKYQNIHARNKWNWGTPPDRSKGHYWSFQSQEKDYRRILKRMLELYSILRGGEAAEDEA